MEEKVVTFDGENFKSAGVQIVEHLKKENDSEDAGVTYKSPHCIRRTTASRLSTAGMPLDKIRDMLGQVDEKTTLSYIYNPNTKQENLNIMNEALNKSDKRYIKN